MRALDVLAAAFAITMSFLLIFVFALTFALLALAFAVPHILYCKAARRPTMAIIRRIVHRDVRELFITLFLPQKRLTMDG